MKVTVDVAVRFSRLKHRVAKYRIVERLAKSK
jgi:hypothetical protein